MNILIAFSVFILIVLAVTRYMIWQDERLRFKAYEQMTFNELNRVYMGLINQSQALTDEAKKIVGIMQDREVKEGQAK